MLSEENKALVMSALGQTYWEPDDGWVWLASADPADLDALMNAVRQEERERVLDAASEYMTGQYGIRALSHPVDRERVLARIRQAKDAGQ